MLGRIWQAGLTMFAAASMCAAQPAANAQQAPLDTQQAQTILERLDRLETENQRMAREIVELRKELAAKHADPPAESSESGQPSQAQAQQEETQERLAVQETRTAELDQKKVESSQKTPLQVTGMLLFNAFDNGIYGGSTLPDPVEASNTSADRYAGATFRQTILGLIYSGSPLPGGGTVDGSVYMDFYGGSSQSYENLFRLRTATVNLRWKNTTVTIGQDKPIISPREPTSLAQVAVSPLTDAGNLWLWEPQARIEQRFTLTDRAEIHAQGGVYMSNDAANPAAQYVSSLEQWRPAYQGRVAFSYAAGEKRFEIAPGYSASATHVLGQSVDSRVASLDWLVRPSPWWDLTGAWFSGRNYAGLGSLQGFTILSPNEVIPVHGAGGWGQITFNATRRWSFHFFTGEEDDRARDLAGNGISRNLVYGANTIWKLTPNVLTAFEISQARTDYLISGLRQNNHYDLALAYLF